MRLFSKIFSIIFVLSVLLVLFVPSVKANCYYDRYDNCVGTCSCPSGTSGTCTCSEASGICSADTSNCKAPTNTPAQKPTNTPQPTATPKPTDTPQPTRPGASPTDVPGGMQCSTTAQCYNTYCAPNNTPTPACSSVCINGHCYTTHPGTNPTITDVACRSSNDYGSWSSCMSGQDICGACAAQGYTCQVRYCINPPNSNQYQISCGCTQPTSPPGNNGSTPTPTAFLRLRLLNPALSPVSSSDVTLCKVRCDTTPCSAVPCQTGVSLADFPGSILADRGGAIRDGLKARPTVHRPSSDGLKACPTSLPSIV